MNCRAVNEGKVIADPATHALIHELDVWHAAGQVATFWWRDDDASAAGPRLDTLLELAERFEFPVGLAVVPDWLQDNLAVSLSGHGLVSVLQHGWAHKDHHCVAGEGAWELGDDRPLAAVLADLKKGREVLDEAFGERHLKVIAPPWNRISERVERALAAEGYRGLTGFGARGQARAGAGVTINHCHCEPISWKRGRIFSGTAKCIGQIVEHLRLRRHNAVVQEEATGLLTHHIDMSDEAWNFMAATLEIVQAHPAARFLAPREVFARCG